MDKSWVTGNILVAEVHYVASCKTDSQFSAVVEDILSARRRNISIETYVALSEPVVPLRKNEDISLRILEDEQLNKWLGILANRLADAELHQGIK